MLLQLLQSIIDVLGDFLRSVLVLLPSSPFNGFYSLTIDNEFLQVLAWIVPIKEIIATCEAWLISVGLFYLYSIALRWVKAIE